MKVLGGTAISGGNQDSSCPQKNPTGEKGSKGLLFRCKKASLEICKNGTFDLDRGEKASAKLREGEDQDD